MRTRDLTVNNRSDIAIIGRACRLPGAPSIDGLWTLLEEGRCAVSHVPEGRWSLDRLGHPRAQERGKSYTWAAGVIDDIWSFDPTVFGISPREAEQMDPQQRMLLELTWEAMEDAGIRPSALAGEPVGVFVGASSLDYGNLRILDVASGDAYAATGNTLSIISNRISYIFDLKGPSFTIDTACSSSLVALDAAVQAIQSGRVDTAVVAGANIMASPFNFICFSNASMLSRTGLCRAFSAAADGYVRSEGGVVLVLRSAEAARRAGDRVKGVIAASKINSDGRTTGISLPSRDAQARLLQEVYGEAGIDPNDLAFVEAHGTGTPVGDPIESSAIGTALGRARSAPLPIGSIKTNIGHTEPVSGLAGLLKASLALEHDLLPPSLHFDEPNPNIRFDELNLTVAAEALPLVRRPGRFAGVNSFGFGGTNAHIVLTDPEPVPAKAASKAAPGREPEILFLSAQTRAALSALAGTYAERLEGASAAEVAEVATAAAHRRERLGSRLSVTLDDPSRAVAALRAMAEGAEAPELVVGTAVERAADVAFVFSGNGSQWPGMGRDAYENSAAFRARFNEVGALFEPLSGWSLKEALFDDGLEERLSATSVAQPLIFAIQAASVAALAERGLKPQMVLGHSVGEIAAAEAAGVLTLEQAVRVIYYRSHHQEAAHELGDMAVLLAPVEDAEALLADFPDLDIAAYNSPKALTVAGPADRLDAAIKALGRSRRRGRRLDLGYPFHGRLMAPAEAPLMRDLAGLAPQAGTVPVVSTVTGGVLAGEAFDAHYWWRNIREPVRFSAAVEAAARAGARVFVEIGPRPTLMSHVGDSIEPTGLDCTTVGALPKKSSAGDPFRRALSSALVQGARIDEAAAFGRDAGAVVRLPTYPWQRKAFRLQETIESYGFASPSAFHPLTGSRLHEGGLEWQAHVDANVVPWLADHRVDGQVIMPGAAFVEMALAVAREWLKTDAVVVTDLEIQQPMIFSEESLREVAVRFSPSANILQILSRPRLSQATWVLHASAKIVEDGVVAPATDATRLPKRGVVPGEELYRRAYRSGLDFGPSFRGVARAAKLDAGTIVAELVPAELESRYGLVPGRLDACFHGLILLFADLLGEDSVRAYVPVRFGEVRLLKPGAAIARAVIRVSRCNERSILADFTLVDTEGAVIAQLRDGRFQALRNRHADDLDSFAITQHARLATEPTAIPLERQPSIAEAVRGHVITAVSAAEEAIAPGHMLLEGWATSVSYRLADVLAAGRPIDVATLTSRGLPESTVPWVVNLLHALEGSSLATSANGCWTIKPGVELPEPAEILRWIAADHPELAAELVLAAEVGAAAERLASGEPVAPSLPQAAVDAFVLRGATARASAAAVIDVLARASLSLPRDRALRILQVGFGPLSGILATLGQRYDAQITVFETDRRLAERARLTLPRGVAVIEDAATLAAASADVVVASDALHRIDRALLPALAGALTGGGLFLAVEPSASLYRDLVFGLGVGWFEVAASDFPVGRLDDVEGWQRTLSAAGLVNVAAERAATANGNDLILMAEAPPRPKAAPGQTFAFVIGSDDDFAAETASSLATLLAASGVHVSIILDSDQSLQELSRETPDTVVFLAGAFTPGGTGADHLRDRCLGLKRCTEHLGNRQTRLWVVCPGATRGDVGQTGTVEAGVWAFTRTLANETANLDVRRIDLAPKMASKRAAERLRDVIMSGTDETEIVLDDDRTRVIRFAQGIPQRPFAGGPAAQASRLERGVTGGLNEMHWAAAERVAPGRGQVEIAVEATGLNFRDVLWALNMLPEEILEDGFAGPRLGLECAGRVVAVGPGVKAFKAGDRVVAFAQNGFSSHITVPELVVAPSPEGLAPAAAATVPVTFLTAYYGLVSCARMRRGEWVLVHGGAGGVGLAALQIAKMKGARVIATAGSPEKRALVAALGAEHVLDSRSLAFADDIRRITGNGVDIVLNSLFGEAMERSLACLKPFGRFVELGKRDYVANTHIGLRPFRRNLSYFGVDLDQLLMHQGKDGAKLFREVMGFFDKGKLKPLPYQPFSADEVSDAFRLMQQSGHVGKIIITPPRPGTVPAARRQPLVVAHDGSHLVTGGFGGFGLEVARWLADRGARHIVLTGRNATPTEEAASLMAELQARGVKVRGIACDVSDRAAVERLLFEVERDGPPLVGLIHGAMVLQDGVIANIERDTLDAVLRPKVLGAHHLDALTRKRSLDYFVLFSSATTFIGNPGQGSYVAANGFMEGLARARRSQGLPALAVAWGAIGDVGVLARKKAVMETLAGRVGVTPMDARRCLDLMAEALSVQGSSADDAVVAIASMHWGKARERLATMRSPSYAELGSDQQAESGGSAVINIGALLKTNEPDVVRKIVADTIVEDIARILRLPKDDISRVRQLSEIGLDSLMGVELGASLQERFGLEAPPSGVSSGMTVTDLTETLIQSVATPVDEEASAVMSLAQRHLGEGITAAALEPLSGLVDQKREMKESLP